MPVYIAERGAGRDASLEARGRAAQPSEVPGQRLEEPLARAHDPDRDGPRRQVEEAGGLLIGATLAHAEREHLAVALGELLDRLRERLHELALLELTVLAQVRDRLEQVGLLRRVAPVPEAADRAGI